MFINVRILMCTYINKFFVRFSINKKTFYSQFKPCSKQMFPAKSFHMSRNHEAVDMLVFYISTTKSYTSG